MLECTNVIFTESVVDTILLKKKVENRKPRIPNITSLGHVNLLYFKRFAFKKQQIVELSQPRFARG